MSFKYKLYEAINIFPYYISILLFQKRASVVEKLNEEDQHSAVCSCDSKPRPHADHSTTTCSNTRTSSTSSTSSSSSYSSTHSSAVPKIPEQHSPPTPPVTPAECNLIDFGRDEIDTTASAKSTPKVDLLCSDHVLCPDSPALVDIDTYADHLAGCVVTTATRCITPLQPSLRIHEVSEHSTRATSSSSSSTASSPPRYTEHSSPTDRLSNALLRSATTTTSTSSANTRSPGQSSPTSASTRSQCTPSPRHHPLLVTLSDADQLTSESHTESHSELIEDHFADDHQFISDSALKRAQLSREKDQICAEDRFATDDHSSSEARKRTSSDAKEKSIFKRTLKSLPSLGGSFASQNLGAIISPLRYTIYCFIFYICCYRYLPVRLSTNLSNSC